MNFNRNLALVGGLCQLTRHSESLIEHVCKPQKNLSRPEKMRGFPSVKPLHDLTVPGKGTGRPGKEDGEVKWGRVTAEGKVLGNQEKIQPDFCLAS